MRTAPVSTNHAEGSGGDGSGLVVRRRYDRWLVPAAITATYVLFAVAVHLRLLDNLDVAVRHVVRPGDVWGPTQTGAAGLAGVLEPGHLAVTLLLVVAALSLLRRSLRPFWVMGAVILPVTVSTVATKWIMSHWDTRIAPVAHGSFPSGHTVVAITAFGIVVLLLRPGTRWGWMLPAVMGCVMGSALVIATVHPATDVMGAGLLAAAALTAAAATLGRWASESQHRNPRPTSLL